MKGKIIVVTHKDYKMPKDKVYMPICVGDGLEKLKNKFQPDNKGENISEKNSTYCELTAIYWAWKNLELDSVDYVGVTHYRRHFSIEKNKKEVGCAVSENVLNQLFEQHGEEKVFVTPKRKYLTSIANHYIKSKKGYEKIHANDIQCLKHAMVCKSPDYLKELESVLNGKDAHMLNMFIMSSSNFEAYCQWLFPIIDKVVELNIEREDQRRYAGALSEFLLDVWLKHNKIESVELALLETEQIAIYKKIYNVVKRMCIR